MPYDKPATLTMLIHGDAGVGKSWLLGSAPTPLLILDAEGRARYLPGGPKVFWDPATQSPPVDDGTWTMCIVTVTKFAQLEQVRQWLQSGQHPFKSVGVDSLTEIQKRFMDDAFGSKQLETQDWGAVLRELEHIVRDFRDLTLSNGNSVECVAFSVGSRLNSGGKIAPLLQGALKDTLPYFLDACGYLYNVMDAEGRLQRNLLVEPRPNVIAKDGTNRLGGPVLTNPDLRSMFEGLLSGVVN
jgi:hypothetical protein